MTQTDVLIIGSGIAGAVTALRLACNPHCDIVILNRATDPHESNTFYAQGGIISRGPDDSAQSLIEDILAAGAGASYHRAAHILAEEGPSLIDDILIDTAGVEFDKGKDDGYEWGQEGAHSHRRILHTGDQTGVVIISAIIKALRELPNVRFVTNATAIDLLTSPHHSMNPLSAYHPITCHGAYVFHHHNRTILPYVANSTVLATGGIGRIFRYTTNPAGARGDGIAMAHRAGVRIANAEYVQFHPTGLAVPGAEGFLISEAVRGEGGVLINLDGEAFMEKYAPEWKDLAPRDIVARAIHHQMESYGYSHVLLDIASRLPEKKIRERFPAIYVACLKVGIDISREPIPVVPAAHYSCGGVLVDEWGRTNIHNLYAVGEVSCTGVHGANRLASTSLLEGLVWGDRTARHIEASLADSGSQKSISFDEIPPWDERGLTSEADPALVQGDFQTVQNIMWHYVGLVRNGERLGRAIRELRHLWSEIETFYRTTKLTDGLIGLRNAVEVALIVAQAALHNRQSRGCHFRSDSISPSSL